MAGLSELESDSGIWYILFVQSADGLCISVCPIVYGADFRSERICICSSAGIFIFERTDGKAEMLRTGHDSGWNYSSISVEAF